MSDFDLIISHGNVVTPEDVIDASFFITAGDTVPITVLRGKEKLVFNLQADFHPASQHPPLAAGLTPKQAIPLKLQAAPPKGGP